jgi:hypothetical protein
MLTEENKSKNYKLRETQRELLLSRIEGSQLERKLRLQEQLHSRLLPINLRLASRRLMITGPEKKD